MDTELRLNIGAGQTWIPGFKNIDIVAEAEIQLDIGRERLPFSDDSVSLIFSHHTLEHIPDHLFALSEMHRVLRHDGTLLLGLPYVTLTEFNLVNPYHLHYFSERSFDFFDPALLKGSAAEANNVLFRPIWVRYHYMPRGWRKLPEPMRRWARRHLFNVVREFDIGVAAIKNRTRTVETGDERRRLMKRQFDDCIASRRTYTDPPTGATGA